MWVKYAVLVIYNKSIKESKSYQSLKSHAQIPVIVCDNSTVDNQNIYEVNRDNNIYLSMNGNKGISFAYNQALRWVYEKSPSLDGYLAFFDHYTDIPPNYFKRVEQYISDGKSDILLPVVKDAIGIMSPVYMDSLKYVHRCKDPFAIPKSHISGINSGLIVSIKLFRDFQYDEELFLDYVDHNFFYTMHKLNKKVKVMNIEIKQNSSTLEDDADKAMKRLKLFKKDIKYFYADNMLYRFVYHYVMIRRKLHYIRLYKDVSVLWKC